MKTPEKSLTKPAIPDKPYPAFPLFAHQNGQWCRKVSGKLHYFGPWADWKAALERHNKEYPYLKAGMVPPESYDGIKVGELCNRFRTAKKFRLDSLCKRRLHNSGLQLSGNSGQLGSAYQQSGNSG